MSESSVGGFLNRKLFQLVDCRFSKCELPSIGGHLRNQAVQTPARSESLTPQLLEVSPRKEEEQEVATS